MIQQMIQRTTAGKMTAMPVSVRPVPTVHVELRIENIHPGEIVVTTAAAEVPAPGRMSDDVLDEWAMDHLFEYAGTGMPEDDGDDSTYEITIVGSNSAALLGRTFEMR